MIHRDWGKGGNVEVTTQKVKKFYVQLKSDSFVGALKLLQELLFPETPQKAFDPLKPSKIIKTLQKILKTLQKL